MRRTAKPRRVVSHGSRNRLSVSQGMEDSVLLASSPDKQLPRAPLGSPPAPPAKSMGARMARSGPLQALASTLSGSDFEASMKKARRRAQDLNASLPRPPSGPPPPLLQPTVTDLSTEDMEFTDEDEEEVGVEDLASASRRLSSWDMTAKGPGALAPMLQQPAAVTTAFPVGASGMPAVFHELVDTEQVFQDRLTDLCTHYRRRLLGLAHLEDLAGVLDQDQIQAVFLNVEDLRQLSADMLAALRRVQERDHDTLEALVLDMCKEAFSKSSIIAMDKGFSMYSARFGYAGLLRERLRRTVPAFHDFCRLEEFVLECSLDSLQIVPVQRLLRYRLLLREMRTRCESARAGALLDKVVANIQRCCDSVNAQCAVYAGTRTVVLLQQALFKNKVTLVGPGRHCVRHALLTVVEDDAHKAKPGTRRFLVLLNDALLYASMSKDKLSGELRHVLAVSTLRAAPDAAQARVFSVQGGGKFLRLEVDSDTDRDLWVADINRLCSADRALVAPAELVAAFERPSTPVKEPLFREEFTWL